MRTQRREKLSSEAEEIQNVREKAEQKRKSHKGLTQTQPGVLSVGEKTDRDHQLRMLPAQ